MYQRFIDDGRAQPLYTYVRANMVWKNKQARPLSVTECEDLMGYPPSYTEPLAPPGKGSKRMARRHAIGNGYHIPSIAVLLSLLICPGPKLAASAAAPSWMQPPGPSRGEADKWEEQHASGTIWARNWADGREPVTTAAQAGEQALSLFAPGFFEPPKARAGMVDDALQALQGIDITLFDNFREYLNETMAPPTATGPDLQALWTKSPAHAAAARQHRPSAAGVEVHLIDPGVGPEEHMQQARRIQHPFANDPPLERDLKFAVQAWATVGPNVTAHRRKRMRILQRLSRAVRELDDYALTQRHTWL